MIENKKKFRLILYLIPALMDCVTGIFMFIGPVRAAILGYDPLIAGSMITARAICCCAASAIVSRYVDSKNALKLMYVANFLLIVTCLLGLFATNLAMLYVTSACAGMFMVIFAVSFQVFMKVVDMDEGKPLSKVVGSYTVAWCVGMAFGPFITGFLMEMGRPADGQGMSIGWVYTYLAAAFLIVLKLVSLIWITRKSAAFMHEHHTRVKHRLDAPEARDKPDLAWLGWTMVFVGVSALGIVRGVFPPEATNAGLPEWQSGSMMMLLSLAMAASAFVMSRSSAWMYSGGSMLLLGCVGVVGMLFYVVPHWMGWSVAEHVWQYYVAALVVGFYSGTPYLYSGYHALAHPEKSGRNISLNESFIGAGSTVGPLLGGWLAKHYGFFPPFMAASAIIAVLAAFQFFAHKRYGGDTARAKQ